ncbi:ABC transporter permease [Geobacillus zalihae]|uniref:ABC transporter permease n=1 Tax=Geobacillus zalihae TaxID=213419 RepID=UPI0009C14806|nr:ABC transporter permease [Geobacillus zalihae]OQP13222.1 ABC transporter permease [Geobacillus zalihae]
MTLFTSLSWFYAKQMGKSILYMGTYTFWFIMLMMRFLIRQHDSFGKTDYGNFVGEMTLIVQAAMLLFMVFFYKLFSDEYRFGANLLFAGSLRITALKIAALFVNHLLFLSFFTGLQVVLVWQFYRTWGLPFSSLYTETASYIAVYWLLPFVFAFFLGIFTALLFGKNRLSFAWMMVIWLAIGPMNTQLFSRYFHRIPFSDIRSLFYIGPLNMDDVFRDVVGYNVSLPTYMKLLFWILTSMMAVWAILWKTARTTKEKAAIITGVVLLLAGDAWLFPHLFTGNKLVFSYADLAKENVYYQTHNPTIQPSTLHYSIERYDIQLEAKNGVHAKVKVTLRQIGGDTLSFVLYHHFSLKRITDQTGKQLPFIQQGDVITVKRSPNRLTDEWTFEYQMNDSAQIPISPHYLFLPSDFSWVPTKAEHAPFAFVNVHSSPVPVSMQPSHPIRYTLSFHGTAPFYTNLPRRSDGTYEGVVSGGITAVAGMFVKEKIGPWQIVHPADWPNLERDWPVFERHVRRIHHDIVQMFDLKEAKLPTNIVLLAPHGEQRSVYSSDHLLLQIDTPYSLRSQEGTLMYLPEIITEGLLWRGVHSSMQKEVFQALLARWFQQQLALPYSGGDLTFDLTLSVDSPDVKTEEVLRQLSGEYERLSDEKKQTFLALWYKQMREGADGSWEKVIQLIRMVQEGQT